MDLLKKLFPFSFVAKDVQPLVISIIVYLVADIVLGVLIGLLASLPIIGVIFTIVGSLLGLYVTVGLVLTVLYFAKVIK